MLHRRNLEQASKHSAAQIGKTSDLVDATRSPARLWRITVIRGGQQINVTLGG